jgi:hypothetical protein
MILTATAALFVSVGMTGCATIPRGRWGVAEVRVEGTSALNHEALEVCLATQARGQLRFPLGALSDPVCGEPPFDGSRTLLNFWSWPWTEWPLFDPSVFSRDEERVERWLRARGYYDGRLLETIVEPADALRPPSSEGSDACASEDSGCPVTVTLRVEEGEPVRVARIEIHGLDEIPAELRRNLRESLPFHSGDVFDEALFADAQEAMLRTLANQAYVDARVFGNAKIDGARHEAYVAFDVSTGAAAVFGQICVYGAGDLPGSPILGATFLEPGHDFSLTALEEAQRAIYALGVFSSVEIRHREDDGERDVVVTEAGEPITNAEGDAMTEVNSEGRVPNPEAIIDPEDPPEEAEDVDGDGELESVENRIEAPSLCSRAYEGDAERVVSIEIHVSPGRLFRLGLGLGWQVGSTLTLAATNSAVSGNNSASLNQWDFHALLVLEDRNLFRQMLRARFEGRPRIIFPEQFPGGDPRPGIQLVTTYRWPGFLEPRTSLIASIAYDYGPAPLVAFFRHELDGRLGLERTFFLDERNNLYLAGWVRGNLFFPEDDQEVRVNSARESTGVLILQATSYLDLRDNPHDPHAGAFFAVDFQSGGFGGLSSWDYIRVTAEARGYIPLPGGLVIAGRFGIGITEIFSAYGLNQSNVYALAQLGPFSEQLTGGGASSNRGFPAGYLGDVELRPIEARPTSSGVPDTNPVLITGGLRRWELSLELRIPITPDIGVVVFGDAGDVARGTFFRFHHPQIAIGAGLRFHTFIGTLRLDVGVRPAPLQVIGVPDERLNNVCPNPITEIGVACRPHPQFFGDFGIPVDGAIHLTIGEAF